jgi:hypothetical protein
MNEGYPIGLDRAARETPQIARILGKKLASRPFNRSARHGIEIPEIGNTACGLVVIAANDGAYKRANTLDHFIRVGAVADYISETYRALPTSGAGLEHRFERGRVRVHVAEYQQAHGKTAETAAEEYEL